MVYNFFVCVCIYQTRKCMSEMYTNEIEKLRAANANKLFQMRTICQTTTTTQVPAKRSKPKWSCNNKWYTHTQRWGMITGYYVFFSISVANFIQIKYEMEWNISTVCIPHIGHSNLFIWSTRQIIIITDLKVWIKKNINLFPFIQFTPVAKRSCWCFSTAGLLLDPLKSHEWWRYIALEMVG